jgi:hypothetical protein
VYSKLLKQALYGHLFREWARGVDIPECKVEMLGWGTNRNRRFELMSRPEWKISLACFERATWSYHTSIQAFLPSEDATSSIQQVGEGILRGGHLENPRVWKEVGATDQVSTWSWDFNQNGGPDALRTSEESAKVEIICEWGDLSQWWLFRWEVRKRKAKGIVAYLTVRRAIDKPDWDWEGAW